MPRKKKTEVKEEVNNEPIRIVLEKKPGFGTGMTRINNMLQEGYSLRDIEFWEEKKNE